MLCTRSAAASAERDGPGAERGHDHRDVRRDQDVCRRAHRGWCAVPGARGDVRDSSARVSIGEALAVGLPAMVPAQRHDGCMEQALAGLPACIQRPTDRVLGRSLAWHRLLQHRFLVSAAYLGCRAGGRSQGAGEEGGRFGAPAAVAHPRGIPAAERAGPYPAAHQPAPQALVNLLKLQRAHTNAAWLCS